ncbi:MAG: hypothetical protein AAGA18_14775 [Verrucomicrobiota bacterium]
MKPAVEQLGDGINVSFAKRTYQLRAIEKPSPGRLRSTVKAVNDETKRLHIDTIDFYLSRSRKTFIGETARLFSESAEVIESDVINLMEIVESYVNQQLSDQLPETPVLSKAEAKAAASFARSPNLLDKILADIAKLGFVGEEENKLVAYLAMTSRKMDDPLALLVLSGSGAGKSHLQNTILSLCPDEDLISLTTLSEKALFYKGKDTLKGKVLALEEEAGAMNASYALRNLISAKRLAIETTVKNPLNGNLETQTNIVEAQTAVFQTTTKPESDAETRSRFIILNIDESAEQTKAILEAQRNSHTLDGYLFKQKKKVVIDRQHAFQRLLQPIKVVNPYEPLLEIPQDKLSLRRDNPKYLNLNLAITFLHQFQRQKKSHPEIGEYIETTLADIELANRLAARIFQVDELSGPSKVLLQYITDYVANQAKEKETTQDNIRFTRRELREELGWSEYQLRTHIKQLTDLEYLIRLHGKQGQLYSYKLIGKTVSHSVPWLRPIEEIKKAAASLKIGYFEGTSLAQNPEVKNSVSRCPSTKKKRTATASRA